MAETRDYLSPAAIASLGSLEIIARTLVLGFLKGLHLSSDKGSSVEFLSYRPYVQGDEIRRLDWRTFGKTDRFYVKEYQDETNLRAIFVLDASASMGFQSGDISKLRYGSCLAAALGYLLVAQRDAVGLALVDTSVRQFIPAKTTPQHLRGIFTVMEGARPEGETKLAAAVNRLAGLLPRRSFIVILSDFLDDPRDVVSSLGHLRHRGAEVLVFHLIDPAEEEFPFNRWTLFRDSENPALELRMDGRQVRELYKENLTEHLEILRKGCRAAGIDYSLINTQSPFELSLATYLESRERSLKRTPGTLGND